MELRTFGIRHHGPGSASALRRALLAWKPDCLLIEGPEEAEKLIPYTQNKGLKPPVAMLVYSPAELTEAVYLPFAEFSPEWQAMRLGTSWDIPVRLIDLPASMSLALPSEKPRKLAQDPMAYLARVAGYTDSERWWEATFEHADHPDEIFPAIVEMIQALRAETADQESKSNLIREAYMRQKIREAVQEGFQKIAVVCGAWHAPVLQNWEAFRPAGDAKLLKGLRKKKMEATWVPWTFERLSVAGGYRAGVIAPAWYRLLFEQRESAVTRWLIRVARLLRQEDLDASSAQVVDAIRLAEALAALRSLSLPGIDEMREAALSTFCEGERSRLEWIDRQLTIGEVIGKVPKEIPSVPLQNDLDQQIRSARLSRERNTGESIPKDLDLRKPTNLLASRLLHRLLILDIPWGKIRERPQDDGPRLNRGSFKESWRLKWKADFPLRILAAGMFGNTVEEAAVGRVRQAVASLQTLPAVSEWVQGTLHAGLEESMGPLIDKLQDQATQTTDVGHLMDALLPLVQISRYGDVRNTYLPAVEKVIGQIIPRICIGLPAATIQIRQEVAEELFEQILSVNGALSLLAEPGFSQEWNQALQRTALGLGVHPLLKGMAVRLLFDRDFYTSDQTSTLVFYGLSSGQEVQDAGQFLEGFLHGSGLLLLHDPALWQVIDTWVRNLQTDLFQEVLPVLRRAFSRFSAPERIKMLQLAQRGTLSPPVEVVWHEERVEQIQPVLKALFGLGSGHS